MIRIAVIDDYEMVREGLRALPQNEPDFEMQITVAGKGELRAGQFAAVGSR